MYSHYLYFYQIFVFYPHYYPPEIFFFFDELSFFSLEKCYFAHLFWWESWFQTSYWIFCWLFLLFYVAWLLMLVSVVMCCDQMTVGWVPYFAGKKCQEKSIIRPGYREKHGYGKNSTGATH